MIDRFKLHLAGDVHHHHHYMCAREIYWYVHVVAPFVERNGFCFVIKFDVFFLS